LLNQGSTVLTNFFQNLHPEALHRLRCTFAATPDSGISLVSSNGAASPPDDAKLNKQIETLMRKVRSYPSLTTVLMEYELKL